jgi:hypothetical protein
VFDYLLDEERLENVSSNKNNKEDGLSPIYLDKAIFFVCTRGAIKYDRIPRLC